MKTKCFSEVWAFPERRDTFVPWFAEHGGSTHVTGAELSLLAGLNGEGLNACSASAAHLQMLHVYNPKSQVGAQMSARP